VSGWYICLFRTASLLVSVNRPARWVSSSAPNIDGESKRGKQHQSMSPLTPTRATVWRSPITPWSSIGRYPVLEGLTFSAIAGIQAVAQQQVLTVSSHAGQPRAAMYWGQEGRVLDQSQGW
jgi:hypothetical protein